MTKSKWYLVFVVLVFISVITLFNVNSAWSDDHNAHAAFIIIGIGVGLLAIGSLYKAAITD